jgi:cation diffusion facilitator CzcD-associated flavoprotein CzcO
MGTVQSAVQEQGQTPKKSVDDIPVIDAVVIGAGFTGVSVASALKTYSVDNFVVLESGTMVGDFWDHGHDGQVFFLTIMALQLPSVISMSILGL